MPPKKAVRKTVVRRPRTAKMTPMEGMGVSDVVIKAAVPVITKELITVLKSKKVKNAVHSGIKGTRKFLGVGLNPTGGALLRTGEKKKVILRRR
jgi:hypothetical protein